MNGFLSGLFSFDTIECLKRIYRMVLGAGRSACRPCPVATRLTRGGSRSRWQSSCTPPDWPTSLSAPAGGIPPAHECRLSPLVRQCQISLASVSECSCLTFSFSSPPLAPPAPRPTSVVLDRSSWKLKNRNGSIRYWTPGITK
jgi:hypothetical protein